MRTIDVAIAFTEQYLINTLLQLGAIYRKSRESRLTLASKCGSHTALKRGVNERLSGRAWRFTEWSRREPSDMDGKPKGEFAGANESNALQFAHA